MGQGLARGGRRLQLAHGLCGGQALLLLRREELLAQLLQGGAVGGLRLGLAVLVEPVLPVGLVPVELGQGACCLFAILGAAGGVRCRSVCAWLLR